MANKKNIYIFGNTVWKVKKYIKKIYESNMKLLQNSIALFLQSEKP